jgi:IS30 family transposase
MPRNYTHVKHIEPLVFEMKRNGRTNAEIAEYFNLTKTQIKELVKRHNRRLRKISAGEMLCPKGRPRTRPLSTTEELQAEIRRLQMENTLLHSFLQAAGRR